MRILFFTDNFPPETNAIANRVFERARYWVRWGHAVTVITSAPNFPQGKLYVGYANRWYEEEVMEGVRVIRIKTFITPNEGIVLRTFDFLSYILPAFLAGLFVQRPDMVAATSPQFFVGVTAWFVARCRRLPFVLEIADLWPASIVAVGAMRRNVLIRLLERLELFLYHRATAIVALTQSFKDDMVRRGIVSEKISVIINGVELAEYAPRERDTALARKWELGDRFIIGYIGTHGAAHGLHNVLATAELLRHEKNILFLLVGAGAEREQLLHAAKKQSLLNVLFIPPQPKHTMPSWWSLCNVALIHLKDDPVFATVIPSKMFEAMAMGLPLLVVAPRGEASQIVEKERTGMWVRAGDPEAFADTVLQLYRGKNLLRTFAQQSRVAVLTYSRERQARDFSFVLTDLYERYQH